MMNETSILRRIRLEIGSDIFDGLDPKWLLDILNEKTLLSFSLHYPKIVKGVVIKQASGILSRHPQTGDMAMYQYIIPTDTEDIPYIGIEEVFFPGNFMNDRYTGFAPTMVDTMMGGIRSMLPTPQIRFNVSFEPPNIAVVDPIPRMHRDFTLNMQRVRRLNEFPLYFYEMLTALYIVDVKAGIYNKFKNARDGATIGGVEVQTFISDYSGAEDERKDLMEKYRKDSMRNPERFSSFLSFS